MSPPDIRGLQFSAGRGISSQAAEFTHIHRISRNLLKQPVINLIANVTT